MPKAVKIGNQVIDPENPGIDRPVVIKEFEVDDPGAERAIEMLSYGFSCVPKLYHVEKNQDSVKIYQEFIEGTHLYDLNPGTLPEVLDCVTEVARALRLVHKQAEAVRDITPDNIIFRDGQAYFIDLSTTNTEYTPGFKPPEVDGGLTGGYCRASDIYQLGVILRSLLHASGQISKPLNNLMERCLVEDPQKRPTAEQVYLELNQANNKQAIMRHVRRLKWVYLFLPLILIGVSLGLLAVPWDQLDRVRSEEDVVRLRAEVADLSVAERTQAALEISQFLTEETLLTMERVDAIFITKNPLVICDGKGLGIGSRVRLDQGLTGYITDVSFEGIEIWNGEDRYLFDTNFEELRGGYSRHHWSELVNREKNIFIREKYLNLEMLTRCIADHLGLNIQGKIVGATAGLFKGGTIKEFLMKEKKFLKIMINDELISQNTNKPALYFPVESCWISPKCHYMENSLGAKIENCHLLNEIEPLFSYSNTLANMLATLNLKLIQSESGYKLIKLN